jgi:hypothetical protein
VTFAQAVTAKVVLFASLPNDETDVVLRASSSSGPAPDWLHVQVDGHPVSKMKLDGAGYQDVSVRIPPDARRPSISEITLHLESGTGGVPVFKLDRVMIHTASKRM